MPRMPTPLAQKFWIKVDKNGPIHPRLGTKCWIWLAGRHTKQGYGRIREAGGNSSTLYAHRVSWELTNGPIPDGMMVLHHCDNTWCVNSEEHLYLGSNRENVDDRKNRGRCNQGEKHHSTFLTEDQAAEIKDLHLSGIPSRKVAKMFGTTSATVCKISRGASWKNANLSPRV